MAEIVERPKPPSETAKDIARRFLRHENAVLGVVLIALIGVMGGVTRWKTFSMANVMNVLLQSSIRGVASVGQAFVILTAGIDLSITGVGMVASITGATLMTTMTEYSLLGYPVSMYTAMPLMVLVGLGFGVANGALVSRISMPALIVTLGMWEICNGIGFRLSKGGQVCDLPAGLAYFDVGRIAGVPVAVIIFIAVGVIAYFVLYHTSYGRSVYAVGGNPVTAWLSGVRIKTIIFSVYAISGLLSGVAGVLWTARSMTGEVRAMWGVMLDTIASVCIGGVSLAGGRGNLIGVIIGVLIIGVINNGMSMLGAGPFMQGVVKGAIIIGAVAADFMRRR